jgi:type IV secretory pathway VirB6-like protein
MTLVMATIMVIWFGVQQALISAQGGGFNMARCLNLFVLLSFAYSFVVFYSTPIPWLGFTLNSFVISAADYIVGLIGTSGANQMLQSIDAILAQSGTATPTLNLNGGLYIAFAYITGQIAMTLLDTACTVILAYAAIAATISGVLGPLFIPFMVFEKTEFLFWGWLRSFLSFVFLKCVTAAAMSVLASLFLANLGTFDNLFISPVATAQDLPYVLMLTLLCVYIILKLPAVTTLIFGGGKSLLRGA